MDVEYSGLELDVARKAEVNGYKEKLAIECDVDELQINLKEHKKAGRSSFTTHLRAKTRFGSGSVEETDWDFHMSVKNAFTKLIRELTHQAKRHPDSPRSPSPPARRL
jgi:hypothetical protein